MFIILTLGALAACAGAPAPVTAGPTAAGSSLATPSSPTPSGSAQPEASGATSHGDIPDNAVFLTYHGSNPGFAIDYVEGWQVTPNASGVVIRDKDSSETVAIVASTTDVAGYVTATDQPALQAQAGFQLIKQDTVQVGGASYVHLAYHLLALPDPVTGKQVPSMIDRYYVPSPGGLAVVSLSTPDGVDNVDAFRRLIASFRWS